MEPHVTHTMYSVEREPSKDFDDTMQLLGRLIADLVLDFDMDLNTRRSGINVLSHVMAHLWRAQNA